MSRGKANEEIRAILDKNPNFHWTPWVRQLLARVEEYEAEDVSDSLAIEEAKSEETVSWEQVKQELGQSELSIAWRKAAMEMRKVILSIPQNIHNRDAVEKAMKALWEASQLQLAADLKRRDACRHFDPWNCDRGPDCEEVERHLCMVCGMDEAAHGEQQ